MDNPLVQLDPGLFVWTIVTFLLLLLVLAKFAWNPLLKILKEREELIQSSLEDAEKAQQELSQLNSEGEAIVNKARAEAQKILSESKTIVRMDIDRGIIISETKHGFICANAGIDMSNVPPPRS